MKFWQIFEVLAKSFKTSFDVQCTVYLDEIRCTTVPQRCKVSEKENESEVELVISTVLEPVSFLCFGHFTVFHILSRCVP